MSSYVRWLWSGTPDLDGLATKAVDTSDPKYAKDPEFKPDKLSTWNHTYAEDGWTRSHNAVRGEIAAMKKVLVSLGGKALASWEVGCMQKWWAAHAVHIHSHHANEEKTLNPFLATRINLPDKLTTDHEALLVMLEKIGAMFGALSEAPDATPIAAAWTEYEAMLLPHLFEEEMVGLPLMMAYFRGDEIGPIVEKIVKEEPPLSLGSFWYFNFAIDAEGEPIDPKSGIMGFAKQEGIPWFVYYIAFKGQVEAYKEQMVGSIDALLSGVPPAPPSRGLMLPAFALAAAVAVGAGLIGLMEQ